MAIRFVEREPAREERTEPGPLPDAPQPAAIVRAPRVKRPKPPLTAAAAKVDDVAIPNAEVLDAKDQATEATPAGPQMIADGLLPGLAEPGRPPKRRRGRMMGFG